MSNVLLLALCLAAGMLLAPSGRVAEGAHQALNVVIIHLLLPAVTLHALLRFTFDTEHLLPVLMPWLLFALGTVLFGTIGRLLGLGRAQIGALTLVGVAFAAPAAAAPAGPDSRPSAPG